MIPDQMLPIYAAVIVAIVILSHYMGNDDDLMHP